MANLISQPLRIHYKIDYFAYRVTQQFVPNNRIPVQPTLASLVSTATLKPLDFSIIAY